MHIEKKSSRHLLLMDVMENEIHIRTMFHLHVFYSLQIREMNKKQDKTVFNCISMRSIN